MKYAIFKLGSRQYQAKEGDTILIDLQDISEGKSLTFSDVLLVADGDNVMIGTPVVAGAKITGEAEDMVKGKKIVTGKFRKREGYKRAYGQRHKYTPVKITQITA